MAKETNKKTHNIFCIDIAKVKSTLLDNADCTMNDVVNVLINREEKYKEQALVEGFDTKGFNVKLFFFGEEKYNSKLESFCRPFVQANQPIVNFRPKTASSVLFIWSETHIFAITTGQGFRVVDSFCVSKFGMQVAGVFENKFRITALDSNTISSVVHSTRTIYSNEVDFIDVDNLDTIFKEVTGRLADKKTVRQLLQLDEKSKRSSMKITAKNYVQFSSSLNFAGLLHILEILDQYDLTQLTDQFNLVVPLNMKHDQPLINANNAAVMKKIYENIKTDAYLGFDLFHRNTNDFIGADAYRIIVDGAEPIPTDDIQPSAFMKEAYQKYLEATQASDTFEAFVLFFADAKLEALREDDVLTSDSLLKHLSGEMHLGDKNYYMFYGEYYSLDKSYKDRLNATLSGKLRPEYFTNEIKTAWAAGDKEDDFNHNASIAEGYLHLHRTKPEQIEFADLVKIENGTAAIVHVKDGFDCSMRELERQVEMSMIRMADLQKNNQEDYIRRLYQNGKKNKKGQNIKTQFPKEQAFVDAMKSCNYRYVIVLRVANKNLLDSDSNIAKHCLNSLILKCFNRGVELKINLV